MRAKLTREYKHSLSQFFHLHVNKPSCNFNFRMLTKLEILHQPSILVQLRMLLVCNPCAQPPCYIDMHSLRILFKKKLY